MTRKELLDVARAGLPDKMRDMENTLASWHEEFPEFFLSRTPPLLLRPELRTNGKGWGGFRAKAVSETDSSAPTRKKNKKNPTGRQIKKQRERSAAILKYIAEHEPLPDFKTIAAGMPGLDMRAITPLVARGYVRHTAKGYVRTPKEWSIKLKSH